MVRQRTRLSAHLRSTSGRPLAMVALWFPLELLSFGLWEQSLERKTYERISNMSVTIES